MYETGSSKFVCHSKNENIPDIYKGSLPALPCYNTWQVAMGDVFCSVSPALLEVEGEAFCSQGKRF